VFNELIQSLLLGEMPKALILKCTGHVMVDTEKVSDFHFLHALIKTKGFAKMIVTEQSCQILCTADVVSPRNNP
jgi:hypothetical protein